MVEAEEIFEIDLELLRNNGKTDKEVRAFVLEKLLIELSIKYKKEFALLEDKFSRTYERSFIDDDDATIIYTLKCSPPKYDFLIFLFTKKMKSMEAILESYE